jgi:hypothetical protein
MTDPLPDEEPSTISRKFDRMVLPDYHGGSIVNLMASIGTALGTENPFYPALGQLEPSALAEARNVLLLVIDGLGYEYLTGSSAGGALRRNLRGRVTSVFPSTTAAAVTSFLTGLGPQQHGLTGWHTYFREVGVVAAVLPFRARHGGPSLSESGIGLPTLLGPRPLANRLRVPCHMVAPERIIHSEFNCAYGGAARRRGYGALDGMFAAMVELVQQGSERKYIYAYFPDLDALAHEHGIASQAAANLLAELDDALGRFLEAIRGTGTAVIVTADHGHIDSGPGRLIELEDHPDLAETLVLPLCGERRVAYCYVHPDREKHFVDYVTGELDRYADLYASADLLGEGWFGLGQPHPRLAERVGHYTLVMKENYAIKDWLPGERRHVHIGVHGGVSKEEMYVPLIVANA